MKTIERSLLAELKNHLEYAEISIITGSRQVGKTTLLKALQEEVSSLNKQSFYFTLERKEILTALDENPVNIFSIIPSVKGEKVYIFIDEIQYLKDPSNFLKLLYDEYKDQIKLIVTGSSAFYIDRKFKDSLAGRKKIFHLSPFSFKEFVKSKEKESLFQYLGNGISNKVQIPLLFENELLDLAAQYLIYGGYPRVVLSNTNEEKEQVLNELIYSFLKKDALEANVRKESEFVFFVEVLADRIGTKINRNSFSDICGISDETVQNYLYILQKSFHISLVRPFWRSKTGELRKMPKFYFQDNGLRNAVNADFSPFILRKDKGELLENMVYNLLRQHYPSSKIQFWNTKEQNEVDFVLNREIAIEVKYNGKQIKQSRYKLFRETYPEIPLLFACYENHGDNIRSILI
ncbi:MAG: ATP-binding protein [Bacteroidales bacterium]|nr:ATP-binding protein [Bacteroidales bacterium]